LNERLKYIKINMILYLPLEYSFICKTIHVYFTFTTPVQLTTTVGLDILSWTKKTSFSLLLLWLFKHNAPNEWTVIKAIIVYMSDLIQLTHSAITNQYC